MTSIAQTDIVFVSSLEISADIGLDRWGKSRPQPLRINIFLHLHSSYLARIGESDDVNDSVHYGILSKLVSEAVSNETFSGVRGLVEIITKAAFNLAGDAAAAVKVVVDSRQTILLAKGISHEVTTPAGTKSNDAPVKVLVEDMVLAIIIGVNPPERESKQHVIVNIVFFEIARHDYNLDYQKIISQISEEIEASSYFTLEKLAIHILRTACLSSEAIDAATVRIQKPSAILFAQFSGVEITRQRVAFA